MKINLSTARVFNNDTKTSYVNFDLRDLICGTIYNQIPDTPIHRSLSERLRGEEADLSSEEVKALVSITNAGVFSRAINDAISICINEEKLNAKLNGSNKMEDVARAMNEVLQELQGKD